MAAEGTAETGRKTEPGEDVPAREKIPNAVTRAAIEEARARKNLTRHRRVRESMAAGREYPEGECRPKPSEVFERHFGPEHGVELPPPSRRGYRPVTFGPDGKA